ncbi:hypothetical protein PHLGIDRAFT_113992 [Phlebiopsis gigantea 11061_1 CR5-6]|uniref:Uncharacterized protein n=1 Tax=Phlebiopsis gigantea (strain 11061_1 CR5-6) TaxID=745531 RepID=A0A0C3SFJ9_PHLG1|nr:hypothetical protein PHLGIDRAFT_113992 [Phlebiopsis gigantea 11061_1 CR5-6]
MDKSLGLQGFPHSLRVDGALAWTQSAEAWFLQVPSVPNMYQELYGRQGPWRTHDRRACPTPTPPLRLRSWPARAQQTEALLLRVVQTPLLRPKQPRPPPALVDPPTPRQRVPGTGLRPRLRIERASHRPPGEQDTSVGRFAIAADGGRVITDAATARTRPAAPPCRPSGRPRTRGTAARTIYVYKDSYCTCETPRSLSLALMQGAARQLES